MMPAAMARTPSTTRMITRNRDAAVISGLPHRQAHASLARGARELVAGPDLVSRLPPGGRGWRGWPGYRGAGKNHAMNTASVREGAAQRVQVLALVQLPGDPAPVRLVGEVAGGG